jgi:hypothetical protein
VAVVPRDLAGDELKDLAAGVVEPEHAGRALETLRVQVVEERMDRGCPRSDRPPNRVADAHDAARQVPARQPLLVFHLPILVGSASGAPRATTTAQR